MIDEMSFPLGTCPTHGPKLAVNGVPTCIRCKAQEDNAGRVMLVSKVEDPGEEYFKGGKAQALAIGSGGKVVAVQPKLRETTPASYTLETGLQEILSILAVIPMPTSMKQYKLLMSVKQKIESALQEGQNG